MQAVHAIPAITLIPLAMTLAPLRTTDAAPVPKQPNAGELMRAIERLSVVGNVLYVAAHPDDENTKLLAYLANEKLLDAAYLSLTRGDGGQNLIGSEQGPLLGLIRTQELLAARRIDGAEQFFTRARDFGYSKTAAETLDIWGRDRVLADLVWVIRRFKPDLIITRFPTQGVETHGHHIASAILAADAFRAAADPKFHPEQLDYAPVWQVKRILWNRFTFGIVGNEELSKYTKLDAGGYNPLLGVSYGEMAAASRSMHKSQGFGVAPTRGESLEYFFLIDGAPAKESIFEGLDLTWHRVQGTEKLVQLLQRARSELRPEAPQAVVPTLLEARREIEALPAHNPYKARKLDELNEVLLACSGLYADATAADFSAVPGSEVQVTALLVNRSKAPWKVREIQIGRTKIEVDKLLAENQPLSIDRSIAVPADQRYSTPYWLEDPPDKGLYFAKDPLWIGLPEEPAPIHADFTLEYGGKAVAVRRAVGFKWTDPVAGERRRPLEIAPPVMINPRAEVLMFPAAAAADRPAKDLRVLLKAGAAGVKGALIPEAPTGWTVSPASIPFELSAKGAEEEVTIRIQAPAGASPGQQPAQGLLRLTAEVDGKKLSQGVLRIEHTHIPIQTLFPRAEVKLVRLDLKRTLTRIGYIPGAGDEVPTALRQVGYEVTILGDDFLQSQPLERFEAIVVGVRAYNTNPRLPFHKKKLLDWVAKGGTLIAQYNTNNRFTKAPPEIGPYPFEISQDRVTDEEAAVTFELANHPILNTPNRIHPRDFEGWIQERGLYFAHTWSDKYATPLSMHDPGEPPRKGSLLVTRHGKGAFIYTGLAFFRQLPAGVPGAHRLFTNLISYGR